MKIGIDLGGSHIGIGVIDNSGNIIEKLETDLSIKNSNEMYNFIQQYISSNIFELVKKYQIEVIGVASPGNPKDGIVKSLINLGIKELNISKIIKNVCDLPVTIKNDAKSAAIAEKKYGSLKQYSDSVFLCLGTGIGGAVFINDELLTPKRNPGFEIGHMIIQKNGELCNCGKNGCFETYCSIKRFKNKLIEALDLSPNINSKELLNIIYNRKEDEIIKKEINIYIENLVIGLSNVIDIFEPQAICLGGGFVYFEEILYKKLLEKYYEKKYVFNKQELPVIKLAKLGNDAGIIGAGETI